MCALRDPCQQAAASVNIASVGQVNVGAQPVNVAETASGERPAESWQATGGDAALLAALACGQTVK